MQIRPSPRSNWNLEVLIFVEGGKPENPEKNPQRTSNKLNPHKTASTGIELGSQRREACSPCFDGFCRYLVRTDSFSLLQHHDGFLISDLDGLSQLMGSSSGGMSSGALGAGRFSSFLKCSPHRFSCSSDGCRSCPQVTCPSAGICLPAATSPLSSLFLLFPPLDCPGRSHNLSCLS